MFLLFWIFIFKRNRRSFGKRKNRGDVDDSVCEDWKKKLPDICEGYEPKDIFIMDETGVFIGRRKNNFCGKRIWKEVK